jgi:hypothetical protein
MGAIVVCRMLQGADIAVPLKWSSISCELVLGVRMWRVRRHFAFTRPYVVSTSELVPLETLGFNERN